ncbi:MAG: DUF664 domain-containing protein [Ignavibacteriales bacterium]|nr:MAG: DUF664 domain-containing protein [Ignavibacteriales bacterium]
MKADEIRTLYEFNEWANRKFIEAVQSISEEKYSMKIKSSFASIRETIAHIVSSEWIWLQRWLGNNPSAPPDWSDKPSIKPLVEKLNEVEAERNKFLFNLKDEDLNKLLIYNLLSGKTQQNILQEVLQHVVNHSTYHRGQLATLFRQIDEKPPSTDLITFYRENNTG